MLLNGPGWPLGRRYAIFKYQGQPTPQPAPLVLTVDAVAPMAGVFWVMVQLKPRYPVAGEGTVGRVLTRQVTHCCTVKILDLLKDTRMLRFLKPLSGLAFRGICVSVLRSKRICFTSVSGGWAYLFYDCCSFFHQPG